MEGVYNKENLFAEFKMQKSKKAKVKFLQDMKQLKKDQTSMFKQRYLKNNLIILSKNV